MQGLQGTHWKETLQGDNFLGFFFPSLKMHLT